ncbi:MAG: hypothetical protein GXY34_10375 [Syntrophomonadaceae bacterium]|nr:hypothetical protein [Syntrophomonadaceae bacterium]
MVFILGQHAEILLVIITPLKIIQDTINFTVLIINRAKLDQEVEYFRKYTLIVLSEKRSALAISRYEEKKKNFYAESRDRLAEISKKILDYNLYCPVSTLGRSNFDVETEMHHIVEEIESLTDELGVSQG